MQSTRRNFVGATAATLVGRVIPATAAQKGAPAEAVTLRSFFSGELYTRKQVDDWFAGKAYTNNRPHPELGWLHRNVQVQDGVDNSMSTYRYRDNGDGERILINYAGRPCRINTYGDSFTRCAQVSDGETWQEDLAAHLGEPVRNFGVGGYSVYQAYLRMLREEERAPAEFLILNIFHDDHFRNLDSWRDLRSSRFGKGTFFGGTLPYLRVNLATGEVERHPNICPTKEAFYNLCDLDWVENHFRDDFVMKILLAHRNSRAGNPELAYKALADLATTHGIKTDLDDIKTADQTATELHTRAAMLSTMKVVEWTEAFAKKRGKKVLYVLSFSAGPIGKVVREGTRFDQPFVDFLRRKGLPYVDLMEKHLEDYAQYKIGFEQYAKKFWIGHYNPRGNLFEAFAIKDKLVSMLQPKPPAYRAG